MSMIPNLNSIQDKVEEGKAFVNMLASCRLDLIGRTSRNPSTILSRRKWQSISMCLPLSRKVGLESMAMVDWLSQKTIVGNEGVTWRSVSNCVKHIVY